jgi:hypothetical protein
MALSDPESEDRYPAPVYISLNNDYRQASIPLMKLSLPGFSSKPEVTEGKENNTGGGIRTTATWKKEEFPKSGPHKEGGTSQGIRAIDQRGDRISALFKSGKLTLAESQLLKKCEESLVKHLELVVGKRKPMGEASDIPVSTELEINGIRAYKGLLKRVISCIE